MKTEKPEVRVVAALIVQNQRILIGQRAFDDSFPGKWEFPGGKVKEGESDEDALFRELQEEMGTEVQVGRLVAEFEHEYDHLFVRICFYHCILDSESEPKATVHEELRWVLPEELNELDFLEGDLPFIELLQQIFSDPSLH